MDSLRLLNANTRGMLIPIILLIMVGIVVLVPVAMIVFKPMDIIVKIIVIFMIFMTVRGYLGNGIPTLAISGILIYFLVFKWWWVGAMGMFFVTLLSIGFFGVVVWGSSKVIR